MPEPVAGQLISVRTARVTEPSHFVVAEPDPERAKQLLQRWLTANEQIVATSPLSAAAIAEHQLQPGGVAPARP